MWRLPRDASQLPATHLPHRSILGGFLRAVDDESLNRAFLGQQFEPELFLYGAGKGGYVVVVRDWLVAGLTWVASGVHSNLKSKIPWSPVKRTTR